MLIIGAYVIVRYKNTQFSSLHAFSVLYIS